ncbi:MAG: ABC transporter ATP-binding protein, partial [Candidatus Ranarchaeia archaeon]
MVEPAMRFDNISYIYENAKRENRYALKELNMEVRKGEFLVVMGANGAGKSTLCLITNSIIPNALRGDFYGKATICGFDTIETPIRILATKVGVCIQNPEAQLFTSEIQTELAFGPQNLLVEPKDIVKRIKWALKIVRLEGFEKRSPTDLSGGQKQRVAIAANLTMMPEVLVLDEPTSQLDPMGTQEVFEAIQELNKETNMTIMMTEHKSEEVAKYADRIVLLKDGKVLEEGSPKKIFSDEDLLKEAQVKPPQCAEIGYKLRKKKYIDDIPLTMEECNKKMKNLLSGVKVPESIGSKYEPSTNLPILEMKNVSYEYMPGIKVLKNINLTIRKGEWVGIVGQNGAGKTTLVKHFLGLLRPVEGNVTVNWIDTQLI